MAGIPIGVDVSKISESGISALLESTVPLLLDSGAFGEVSVCSGKIVATKPISDSEWHRRLQIYLRISRALCQPTEHAGCPRVTIIAPDHVGSQELTLRRLKKFKTDVQAIKDAGAEVIVPLQVGRLNIADFYHRAVEILGFKVVPAIPMKKAACSADDIVRFLQRTRVPRIHLLGIGPANPKAESLLRQMRGIVPELRISLDSNRIRAGVGQNRPITIGERQYLDEFAEPWSGEVDLRDWGGLTYDMTELLFSPSYWLPQVTDIEKFANSLTWLPHAQRCRFAHDPDAFLREEDIDEWLAQCLMQSYAAFVRRQARPAARSKAVATTLQATLLKINGCGFLETSNRHMEHRNAVFASSGDPLINLTCPAMTDSAVQLPTECVKAAKGAYQIPTFDDEEDGCYLCDGGEVTHSTSHRHKFFY